MAERRIKITRGVGIKFVKVISWGARWTRRRWEMFCEKASNDGILILSVYRRRRRHNRLQFKQLCYVAFSWFMNIWKIGKTWNTNRDSNHRNEKMSLWVELTKSRKLTFEASHIYLLLPAISARDQRRAPSDCEESHDGMSVKSKEKH